MEAEREKRANSLRVELGKVKVSLFNKSGLPLAYTSITIGIGYLVVSRCSGISPPSGILLGTWPLHDIAITNIVC